MPWDIVSQSGKDLHSVSVRVCNLIFIHRRRSSPHSEVTWLSHTIFKVLNFPTHSENNDVIFGQETAYLRQLFSERCTGEYLFDLLCYLTILFSILLINSHAIFSSK